MCDYSLCGLPNRLAIEGEELVIYPFPTGTIGMANVAEVASIARMPPRPGFWARLIGLVFSEPKPGRRTPLVVCLPPGATLKSFRTMTHKGATLFGAGHIVRFTQLSPTEANTHRDVIALSRGRHILIQELPVGLCFEVLSLAENKDEQPRARRFYEEEEVLG